MLLRSRASVFLRFNTFSSVAAEQKLKPEDFRTTINDPKEHTSNAAAKFYRMEQDVKKKLFSHGGLPKTYEKQLKTFGEACIMVREPALEIIDHISKTDFSKPATRYVLYGDNGVGKTITLAHMLHYGHSMGFLLVHVPWAPYWFKHPKESGNSTSQEGLLDLPLDAAAWLIHFKAQNMDLLTKLDLKCSKDYVWSKRETTPAGSKLVELIDHGINRVKFSSDAIAALLGEIKKQSTEGKLKTMVVIDGFNSFFYPQTMVLNDNKQAVTPEQITLTQPFRDITSYDWCNGVCILSVDKMGMLGWERESVLPRYLLGKEGFEHLDPFIPIKIDAYSDKEFDSCVSYYVNRRWIQNVTEGFDKELKFLSNNNPYDLMDRCKAL